VWCCLGGQDEENCTSGYIVSAITLLRRLHSFGNDAVTTGIATVAMVLISKALRMMLLRWVACDHHDDEYDDGGDGDDDDHGRWWWW
jgi:hypothetical protein